MSIEQFASDVQAKYGSGLATEHTYRTELETLMTATGGETTQAINEPKRSGSNAPDFYISRGVITVGFIEAKDIDKNLNVIEKDEQLTRYRSAYTNLILTNHLEFRWYLDGEMVDSVTIGTLKGKNINFNAEAYPKLESLLRRYHETVAPTIYKPEDLAERMAKLARELARLIEEALENPIKGSDLPAKKEAVEQVLIPNMTNRQFADMFAQTIAYGLFAARASSTGKPENFTLETAFFELPKTNPFLKKLFQNLATELDKRVKHMASLIAELLAHAKGLDEVIANFGHSTKRQDPVIHFYETFLSAYDPSQREKRGVYYTPEPVVSYIVRSVDHILKTTFGRTLGLADDKTLILDPATGTGTFLYQVIQHIHDSMAGNMGMWKSYVQKNLLPRIFGFELLMAPYTIAHMKLSLLLKELGYDFTQNDRLGVYLTNTLEENVQQPSLQFAEYISDEANSATRIKRDEPIMVVLGNPPYSVSSTNNSPYIEGLMNSYKKAVRGERNIQPLSDDYIKFIRFAHERISMTGHGILSFITSHVYLFGLIHRGMREELIKFFDEIYVLNLHGNSIIKETTPDGNNDQNVFDIRQGVSIVIFVKKENSDESNAKVFYSDLWGKRKEKYLSLSQSFIQDTNWQELKPVTPYYFFIPKEFSLKPEYDTYTHLKDIFEFEGGAIKTRRDYLLVEFDKQTLKNRIEDILKISDLETLKREYKIQNTKYKILGYR